MYAIKTAFRAVMSVVWFAGLIGLFAWIVISSFSLALGVAALALGGWMVGGVSLAVGAFGWWMLDKLAAALEMFGEWITYG